MSLNLLSSIISLLLIAIIIVLSKHYDLSNQIRFFITLKYRVRIYLIKEELEAICNSYPYEQEVALNYLLIIINKVLRDYHDVSLYNVLSNRFRNGNKMTFSHKKYDQMLSMIGQNRKLASMHKRFIKATLFFLMTYNPIRFNLLIWPILKITSTDLNKSVNEFIRDRFS